LTSHQGAPGMSPMASACVLERCCWRGACPHLVGCQVALVVHAAQGGLRLDQLLEPAAGASTAAARRRGSTPAQLPECWA
jgi:hypothetical protein